MNPSFIKHLYDLIVDHFHPPQYDPIRADMIRDAEHLHDAIAAAREEIDTLKVEAIEEAADVKALHDRLDAVVVHCRVLRNNLDRIEGSAESALEFTRVITAHVEQPDLAADGDL